MTVSEYYILHNEHHRDFPTTALVILGMTLLVGLVGLFVQKAETRTSRRDLLSDFAMMLFIKFGLIGIFLGASELLSLYADGSGGPGGAADRSTPWSFEPLASALPLPPLLALLLYMVIRDLGQWLKHVALHKVPCLWSLHKVHHANVSLSIFSDYRIHIVEVFIGSLVTFGTLLITGYPPEFAFIAISLEEMISMFNHANLRLHYGPVLSRVVTSPQNHRVHHSREAAHLDATGDAHNFAILFPIWDILYGSYFWDIEEHPCATGVIGEENLERAGFFRRQWLGFRDSARELAHFRLTFDSPRRSPDA
jgi:sterol desaturase/sphingolipid hydroxylase (fatty acid hydroxylase superfamily)